MPKDGNDLLQKMFEKLEAKIDDHYESISDIKQTLVKNTASLEYHIKRTDMLETKLNSIPQKLLTAISILGGLITVASKFL